MAAPNDIVPIRPRTPRYRCRALYQLPRRGELRPAQVSFPTGDPDRALLEPPSADIDQSWTTLGIPNVSLDPPVETPGVSRHQWPYGPVPGPEWFRNRPGTWDYALNGHHVPAQIVPDSTGRGLIDPRRAGSDLVARIYSAKQWGADGTLEGISISETWAWGNRFSSINGSATETPIGARLGREMVPSSFYFTWSESSEEDDSSVLVTVALDWPIAAVASSGGDAVWRANNSQTSLGAGLPAGAAAPILAPALQGQILLRVRDSEGEETTNFGAIISPARQGPSGSLWDIEPLPLYLCGYQIVGHVAPGKVGTPSGSVRIGAVEFWGADEWT